jgi:hypothetical protein
MRFKEGFANPGRIRCTLSPKGFALIAAFLVTLAIAGLAQEQKFKAVPVKTPDGLSMSAQDCPDGPEILFIQGFSQSHLLIAL